MSTLVTSDGIWVGPVGMIAANNHEAYTDGIAADLDGIVKVTCKSSVDHEGA